MVDHLFFRSKEELLESKFHYDDSAKGIQILELTGGTSVNWVNTYQSTRTRTSSNLGESLHSVIFIPWSKINGAYATFYIPKSTFCEIVYDYNIPLRFLQTFFVEGDGFISQNPGVQVNINFGHDLDVNRSPIAGSDLFYLARHPAFSSTVDQTSTHIFHAKRHSISLHVTIFFTYDPERKLDRHELSFMKQGCEKMNMIQMPMLPQIIYLGYVTDLWMEHLTLMRVGIEFQLHMASLDARKSIDTKSIRIIDAANLRYLTVLAPLSGFRLVTDQLQKGFSLNEFRQDFDIHLLEHRELSSISATAASHLEMWSNFGQKLHVRKDTVRFRFSVSHEITNQLQIALITELNILGFLERNTIQMRRAADQGEKQTAAAMQLNRAMQQEAHKMGIVAVLTMIYLPGTFVATLFSMDMFSLTEDTLRFKAAGKIWIWICVAVPLTLLTNSLAYFLHVRFSPVASTAKPFGVSVGNDYGKVREVEAVQPSNNQPLEHEPLTEHIDPIEQLMKLHGITEDRLNRSESTPTAQVDDDLSVSSIIDTASRVTLTTDQNNLLSSPSRVDLPPSVSIRRRYLASLKAKGINPSESGADDAWVSTNSDI
ncbi:hypothetical protein EDB81DRAFT_829294 [Dactylonectria macrodidyma]|uniref:Uncharacterized protein n=1 Tax=Dactylonectria macrodidyma TaxID=307937 RepID=A0A9P9D2R0_9HYPO|nr:hypothetical protein EDB81DRAFT_829294 [Dactylonectria macrodidyma]